MHMKECRKCHVRKFIEAFANDTKAPDGKYRWCKDCSRASNQAWYQANKASVVARVKQSRTDPVVYKAQLESNKRWRESHPEQANEHSKRSQARAKGAVLADLTHEEWEDLLRAANNSCTYCRKKFTPSETPQQDHVVPLSRGGQHTKANVVPACRSCNRTKGNRTAIEFLQ